MNKDWNGPGVQMNIPLDDKIQSCLDRYNDGLITKPEMIRGIYTLVNLERTKIIEDAEALIESMGG